MIARSHEVDLVDTWRADSQSLSVARLARKELPHVSKRFAAEVWDEAGLRCELLFPAFDYARIAAISGWMPMMFITRVRL